MRKTTTAIVLALAASAAQAQEVIELDEITVTAEAEPVETARTGATVTVVTEEDLQATAETRVIDYLASLPGVGVLSRGGIGTQTSFTIRGISQNYVRVLVDGIDVTDPSTPQTAFDFGSLTTSDVRRIEILRGTQSALYGSDAIGGVISITTTGATEDGVTQSAAVEAGSYGTFRGSYGYAWKDGANEAAISLSRVVTDGFSAADENAGNTEADGFDGTRLSFRLARDVGAAVVGLNGFVEDSTGAFDEQFPISDGNAALDESTDTRAVGLRAFAQFDLGAVSNDLSFSTYDVERRVTGSTSFGPEDNTYIGERATLAWIGATDLGLAGSLRFGADYADETFRQRGNFGSGDGTAYALGAFAEWSGTPLDGLDLTATLRHDETKDFGGFTTWRLAAAYALTPDTTLRGQVGTGFRAPSLYELYGPFGLATLQPEESRSADIGIEHRLAGDGVIAATLFWTEVDNLIDFPFPYAQIPGTVRRQGIELEGRLPVGERFMLEAGYTYTDAQNPPITPGNTWNSLFGRHDLTLGVSAELTDRLSSVFQVQHVADRQTLPDYTVANATFTYALSDGTEAYLRIENIFDEEYQLRSGYGTSDRAYYLGLRTRF